MPRQTLSAEDVIRYVKDIMTNKRELFLKEFEDYDLCNTGSVRKDVLYKILQKYAFRLTDDQVRFFFSFFIQNNIT